MTVPLLACLIAATDAESVALIEQEGRRQREHDPHEPNEHDAHDDGWGDDTA